MHLARAAEADDAPEQRHAAHPLFVMQALEDLGIGFSLSTHDLEIRGAGEILGEEHPLTLQCRMNYALCMAEVGDLKGAALELGEANQAQIRLLGSNHPNVASAPGSVASAVIFMRGDPNRSEPS